MARKPMMAGNWKMNNTIAEAVVLAQEISNHYEKEWPEHVDVVVCPPYVDLKPVKTVFDFDKAKVSVAAQNVYWEPAGAFTGEVSVPMLKEIGCTHCIVGHSERRELFGETNEDVNRKVKALVARRHRAHRVRGRVACRARCGHHRRVRVRAGARRVGGVGRRATWQARVIAYEPIWAIGTGRTATPEQAEAVCAAIRATLGGAFRRRGGRSHARVLYGGSMNPGNVEALVAQPDIDGGLVGGASLKAESFVQLIEACL